MHADSQPDGENLAVAATIPDLPLPAPGSVDLCPHRIVKRPVVSSRTQHGRTPAKDVLGTIAGHFQKRGIHRQDALLRIGKQDGLLAGLEDTRIAFQNKFIALMPGDVTQNDLDVLLLPTGFHTARTYLDRNHAASRITDFRLEGRNRTLPPPSSRKARPDLFMDLRTQIAQVPAAKLVGRLEKQHLCRKIDGNDLRSARLDDQNGIRRALEQRLVALFHRFEFALRTPFARQINHRAHNRRHSLEHALFTDKQDGKCNAVGTNAFNLIRAHLLPAGEALQTFGEPVARCRRHQILWSKPIEVIGFRITEQLPKTGVNEPQRTALRHKHANLQGIHGCPESTFTFAHGDVGMQACGNIHGQPAQAQRSAARVRNKLHGARKPQVVAIGLSQGILE